MNSEDYERIGKELKRRNPGKWPDNTDEEVGVVGVKFGLWPPKDVSYIPPDEGNPLFPGWAADRQHSRNALYTAKAHLEIEKSRYPYEYEIAVSKAKRDLEELPTVLARAELVAETQHNNTLDQLDASTAVYKAAAKLGVDPSTLGQIRLMQETANAEVGKQKQLSDIQVDAQRKLSEIKIDEAKELEDNRLAAYRTEIGIDLNAALAQRLITHEQILGIQTRLKHLILEREEIEQMKVTPATKERLLASHDEVIKAFQENLREQMARHLLEAGNGKDLEAANSPSDSPSGN